MKPNTKDHHHPLINMSLSSDGASRGLAGAMAPHDPIFLLKPMRLRRTLTC